MVKFNELQDVEGEGEESSDDDDDEEKSSEDEGSVENMSTGSDLPEDSGSDRNDENGEEEKSTINIIAANKLSKKGKSSLQVKSSSEPDEYEYDSSDEEVKKNLF